MTNPIFESEGYAEATLFSFCNAQYMTRLFNESTIKEQVKPFSESFYRDELSKQINGKTEVKTPAGNIDVLSDTQIIEVKVLTNWKGALGQVLAYSYYYPKHKKSIHLYGKENGLLGVIRSVCSQFNVDVTYVPAQSGIKKSRFSTEPLTRPELLTFMQAILDAYHKSKSQEAIDFYMNLLHRVQEAILDTYSLEELKTHNANLAALSTSVSQALKTA